MIEWSNYKKDVNLINWLALQNDHAMFIWRGSQFSFFFIFSFLKTPKYCIMFNYSIIDFVCVHQDDVQ